MRRPKLPLAPALAALLFLATASAAGCGSSHHTISVNGQQVGEGTCDQGHCEFTWEFAFGKDATPRAAWSGSANRGVVFDASGDALTFDAAAPHRLFVAGEPSPAARVQADGTFFLDGLPAGWVGLGLAADGAQIALLVDGAGRRVDLVRSDDGVRAVAVGGTALLRPARIEGADARPFEDLHPPG